MRNIFFVNDLGQISTYHMSWNFDHMMLSPILCTLISNNAEVYFSSLAKLVCEISWLLLLVSLNMHPRNSAARRVGSF